MWQITKQAMARSGRRLGDRLIDMRAWWNRVSCAVVARTEPGQSTVEYAVVVAIVVVAIMAAVGAFTTGVAQVFNNILARIQGLGV